MISIGVFQSLTSPLNLYEREVQTMKTQEFQ